MTAEPPVFSVEVVDDDAGRRLVVAGELDVATAPALDAVLADLAPGTPVDALGLTFCDSTGLSRFIAASRRYQAAGERMVLLASSNLRRTIELASVTSCFDLPDATD